MKKIETYFEQKSKSDSKHILNTCNRQVPQQILDQIEAGCSIETLEVLLGRNFNIYKYGTQITIHGLFPDVSTRRIGGSYVNLVQNKNRSIGVRYNAIDHEKKTRLFQLLKETDDWRVEENSTSYHIYKMEDLPGISSWNPTEEQRAEYNKKLSEILYRFREQADRIDKSLFVGNVSCYLATTIWGNKVIVLCVDIQCFYERNFKAIFENISGMTLEEGQAIMERKIAEREEERKRRDEQWEIDRQKAAAAKAERKAAFLAANAIPNGFVKNEAEYQPQRGDIIMKLQDDMKTYSFKFYTFVRHAGRLLIKPCDVNGKNLGQGHEARKTYKGGWLKRAATAA